MTSAEYNEELITAWNIDSKKRGLYSRNNQDFRVIYQIVFRYGLYPVSCLDFQILSLSSLPPARCKPWWKSFETKSKQQIGLFSGDCRPLFRFGGMS